MNGDVSRLILNLNVGQAKEANMLTWHNYIVCVTLILVKTGNDRPSSAPEKQGRLVLQRPATGGRWCVWCVFDRLSWSSVCRVLLSFERTVAPVSRVSSTRVSG